MLPDVMPVMREQVTKPNKSMTYSALTVEVCWANAGTVTSNARATRIAVLRMENLLTRRGSKGRVRAAVAAPERTRGGRTPPPREGASARAVRPERMESQFEKKYHARVIPS